MKKIFNILILSIFIFLFKLNIINALTGPSAYLDEEMAKADKGTSSLVTTNGDGIYHIHKTTNGYALNGNLDLNGKLLVIDKSETVDIYFNHIIDLKSPLNGEDAAIINDGTLNIYGEANFKTNNNYLIKSTAGSTLNIKSGKYDGTIYANKAELIIDNGTIKDIKADNSTVTINNGNFNTITLNQSDILIKSGTFNSENTTIIFGDNENTHSIEITDGKFTSTKENSIEINGGKQVTIAGGNFIGYKNALAFETDTDLILTGGSFYSDGPDNNYGAITFYTSTTKDYSSFVTDGYKYLNTIEVDKKDSYTTTQKYVQVMASENGISNTSNDISSLVNSKYPNLKTEAIYLFNEIVNDNNVNGIDEDLQELIRQTLNDKKQINVDIKTEEIDENNVQYEIASIKNFVNDSEITGYFDLRIVIEIDGKKVGVITELNKPIDVNINIPEDIINGEDYAIVRFHNGRCEVLKTTQNKNGTLTFRTDRFSTYAITYNNTLLFGIFEKRIVYSSIAIVVFFAVLIFIIKLFIKIIIKILKLIFK